MLQGKTALITGASKGIGYAIARKFAAHGAHLILISRDSPALQKNKQILEDDFQASVAIFEANVADLEQVKRTFSEIAQQKIEIDIVVNNAGVMIDAALLMLKQEVIIQNMETNLYGTIYIAQAAVKSLIRKRAGSIINLSSIVGIQGSAGQSAYAAAKSGVIGFTKSLSKELAPLGIRVNAIAPGFIDTDLVSGFTAQAKEKVVAGIGMKRAGTPDDVANTALFLASDLSAYVTGQVIGVDGGMII